MLEQGVDIYYPQDRDGSNPLAKGQKDGTSLLLNQAAAQGKIELFDYFVSLGVNPMRSMAPELGFLLQKTANMIAHLVERYHFDDVKADDTCSGLRDLHDLVWGERFEERPLKSAAVEKNVTAVGN